MNDSGRSFFRFIGWISGVALAVLLVVVVVLIIEYHFDEEPPDVAAFARSQPVVAEDQATTSAISEDLKALAPAHAPWLVAGPTAIFDRCTSEKADTFMPSWTPTTCMRMVIAYFFSDTPFPQHLQAWSTTLRAAGWNSYSSDAVSTSYERPAPPDSAAPVPTISLTIRFAQHPETSTLFAANFASPPPAFSTSATSWIQNAPVSPAVVDSAPFAQYSYVAAVTLTACYDDPSNPPTPTPTGNPAAGQCITGSGTCN